jgi:hypothetical protein
MAKQIRTTRNTYVVLDWRQDARYHIADAYGSRIYRNLQAAERFAAQAGDHTGRNVVVRSLQFVGASNAAIDAKGRITLLTECPCLMHGRGYVPECTFHGDRDMTA